jgi:hypothetical protein
MTNRVRPSLDALPGPFATPPSPHGMKPSAAVFDLVQTQVGALLASSPAYYDLPEPRREQMRHDLEKIATYSAALVQDEWASSQKLGQTPVLREQTTFVTPRAGGESQPGEGRVTALASKEKGPAADEFSPRAASNVARVTKDTLNAVSFPSFVADLIKGTFQAIVNASIQQMEAYGALLANVAKTVDQFMADNVSDNNARDYLVNTYPSHFKIDTSDESPKVVVRDNADEHGTPDFKGQFGLNADPELSDEEAEKTLVPAARRRLAQNRHSMLATMVLMGINRIVITSGRIRATMGFHIDAHDTGTASSASQFDFKNETTAGAGGGISGFFGGPHVETKNTIAYVSSTKRDSSDSLNVSTDLTGEVDLKFKSDYFPMERFANPQMMSLIQGNTPNPKANQPVAAGANQERPAAPTGGGQ